MNNSIKKILFILILDSIAFGKNSVRSTTLLSDLDLVSGNKPAFNEQASVPTAPNSGVQDAKVLTPEKVSAVSDEKLAPHVNQKIALNMASRNYIEPGANSAKIRSSIGNLAANDSMVSKSSSNSEEILIQNKNQPVKIVQHQDATNSNEPPTRNTTIVTDVTKEVTIREILETSTEYHFSTFGRDDPFKPSVKDINETVQVVKDGSPVTSILQEHDLKDLKLVGVWKSSSGGPKAMVSVPRGGGMIVQIGDLIGTKGGRILDILEDRLVVREFLVSFDGTRQFEDKQLLILSKVSSGNAAVSDFPEVPDYKLNPGGAGASRAPQLPNTGPVAQPASFQNTPMNSFSNSQLGTGSAQKLLYDYKAGSDQGAGNKNQGTKPVTNR